MLIQKRISSEHLNRFHNYLLLARALRTRSFLSCTARCLASTSFLNMNIEETETDARWRSHGDKTRGNLQLRWKLPVKVFPSFPSLSPQHLLNVSGRKLENISNFSCCSSYKISRDVPEVSTRTGNRGSEWASGTLFNGMEK